MVKMKDVAERAGVSVSTVSNVINDRTAKMNLGILGRVQRAIADLGYQPNHAARSLKTGYTPLIGLLIPSINNPVYGALARQIESMAQDLYGLRVLIGNSYRNKDKEMHFLKDLLSHGIRGVIVISPLLEQDYFREFIQRGLVVISYDRRSTEDTDLDVDYVSMDNYEAGNMATEHLIQNGHRKLVYVTPAMRTVSRSDKINGFLTAVQRAGISDNASVIDGQISPLQEGVEMTQLGFDFAQRIAAMENRPTGVVAMNDLVAIGLISGFQRLGFKVPEDFSVVGIDDIFLSDIIYPGITTVSVPVNAMAEKMVERIVFRLNHQNTMTANFKFPPTLVVRNSVLRLSAP